MGWLWFIPAFHMPQPPPRTLKDPPERSHIRLSRKDIDFPLGIGAWIIDIDVEMAWIPMGIETSFEVPRSVPPLSWHVVP